MPKISRIGDRHPLIPHYKKNAIWSPGFAMLVKDKDGKTTVKSREIKNKFDMKNETLNPTHGAMYRLGLQSTELSIYYKLKNENEC